MNTETELLRSALEREFNFRKKTNPRYSLRAFGRYLDVDPSTLSKVMNNERSPSQSFVETVIKKLQLPLVSEGPKTDKDIIFLSPLEFRAISSWEHFAILDLVNLKTFTYDYKWICSKLGIKEAIAREAIHRLISLGLMIEKDNTLMSTGKSFSNHPDHTTNSAKKEYQRQLLKKALEAIDHCSPQDKDITSITIAADPKRLQLAKEKIKAFRRELCAFLESGEKTEVLHLTIQLCPANTQIKESI